MSKRICQVALLALLLLTQAGGIGCHGLGTDKHPAPTVKLWGMPSMGCLRVAGEKVPLGVYYEAARPGLKNVRRVEILILLTPHIIEGDRLTTGYEHDFQAKMDKGYEEYAPITTGSDLSGRALSPRLYQEYPGIKEEKGSYPFEIKPLREN